LDVQSNHVNYYRCAKCCHVWTTLKGSAEPYTDS
jgi:hypothetical protein